MRFPMLAFLVLSFAACHSGSGPAPFAADTGSDTQLAQDADLPSDTPDPPETVASDTSTPVHRTPGRALRAASWLRGDLHMHTLWSDGDDSVAITVALAEYLGEQEFLTFHPDFEEGHLDFIAVTDHNVTDVATDPEFTSETLILIPGEELGGPGHANLWPLTEAIGYDPDGDGATLEDYQAAVAAIHDAGGYFSMNHPMEPSLEFAWDIRGHDAVEVWNVGWALGSPTYTAADLDEWEATHGPASPLFRKAATMPGLTGCGQALALYQAQLTRGAHPAVVGGSDRHAFFPVGWPTTWVRAETADTDGVMGAIRDRETFVSRTPLGPTLDLTVTVDDVPYPMGAAISIPEDGAQAEFSVRVGGAKGGLLRLLQGHEVDSDEALADAQLTPVILEIPIDGNDETITVGIGVNPGDWILPVIWDPLVAPDLHPKQANKVPDMAYAAFTTSSSDYLGLAGIFGDILDVYILTPELCDPMSWVPGNMHCMTAEPNGVATYFLPDWVTRPLNVIVQDGEITDWCMGAVGSAIRFTD